MSDKLVNANEWRIDSDRHLIWALIVRSRYSPFRSSDERLCWQRCARLHYFTAHSMAGIALAFGVNENSNVCSHLDICVELCFSWLTLWFINFLIYLCLCSQFVYAIDLNYFRYKLVFIRPNTHLLLLFQKEIALNSMPKKFFKSSLATPLAPLVSVRNMQSGISDAHEPRLGRTPFLLLLNWLNPISTLFKLNLVWFWWIKAWISQPNRLRPHMPLSDDRPMISDASDVFNVSGGDGSSADANWLVYEYAFKCIH